MCRYKMGKLATLYITLLSVSMAVLMTMEGLPFFKALSVGCVACVFKTIASHLHHIAWCYFHPEKKEEPNLILFPVDEAPAKTA